MTRRSKKSEMLEVRLSLDDKEALRAKAALEGSTVSATVRRLIADYLRQPEAEVVHPIKRTVLMTLIKHPKKALASVAALVAGAFILTPAANADPLRLALEFEQKSTVTETSATGAVSEGMRIRRSNTEVEVNSGEKICFLLDAAKSCDPDIISENDLVFVLTATETELGVLVAITLMQGEDVLAKPSLTVAIGETGRFLTENEDGTGISFSIAAIEG